VWAPTQRSLPTWCELLEQGLDVSACEVREDMPTALTVCVAYDADRMMVTHEPINRNLEALLERKPVLRKLRSARHVHLACALRRPKKWLPVLKMLKGEGISVSADFGWNPDVPTEEIRAILHQLDFAFPNEHEAQALTGTDSTSEALLRLGAWVRVPVITMGSRGAMLLADGKHYQQPALTQRLVDATGAGDAFNGGFLHAFLLGSTWDDCLRAGNICGGSVVSAPGGSRGLPSKADFHRHLQKMRSA